MEISDIRIFYEVAARGSTVEAANHLGYTQSNISKRIAKLEEELGNNLFHRTNKGMQLTEKGELFIEYARKFLDTYEEMSGALKIQKDVLKIGVTQTISHNYLTPYYLDEHIEIFINNGDAIIQQLKEGRLDCVMINREVADQSLVEIQTFKEEINFAESLNNGTSFNDVKILVSRDNTCPYRRATLQYIDEQDSGKTPAKERIIEVDTLDMLMRMLENNGVTALVPKKLIESNSKIKVIEDGSHRNIDIFIYALRGNEKSLLTLLPSFQSR